MSARRVLRAFGYERRSRDNVREICEEFGRAGICLCLTLTDPPALDEQLTLTLQDAARPAAPPNHAGAPAPLPRPGQLARGSVADVIAAVRKGTVQVFTDVGGGSGVIVDPDGLVLTCRHVVDGEDGLCEREVRVDFWDGTHLPGTVVRSHRTLDFALVVVPRRALPAVPLGDALRVREAETLYVVGSPAGLCNTVTRGIVSAARRACATNVEYIQTDAPISPGNSGGPVVTERGDLIGISTWAYRGSGDAPVPGISFAVPVDYMADEVEALRQIGLQEACRLPYCRHCGWLQPGERRYCENCGAMFAEKILTERRAA